MARKASTQDEHTSETETAEPIQNGQGTQPATPLVEAIAEEIPPGHSARLLVLSNEQWEAIDRQAKRNKITDSQWLRRFLQPYLRRG